MEETRQVKKQIDATAFHSKNVIKRKEGSMLILEEMNRLINGDIARMNLKIMSKAHSKIKVSLKQVQQ